MESEAGAIQELARHWEPLLTVLIVGIVQAGKTIIPVSVVPALNLTLGIGLMVALTSFTVPAVIAGAMVGLAASGLWSSGKATVKTVKKNGG